MYKLSRTPKIKGVHTLFHQQIYQQQITFIFNSWYIFSSTSQTSQTSFATEGHLKIPVTTTTYSKGSFISMATNAWNNIQGQIKDPMINTFSPNKLKIFLFDFNLNPYQIKAQFAEGSEPPDLLTTLPPLLVAHPFLEFSNLPPQLCNISAFLCISVSNCIQILHFL